MSTPTRNSLFFSRGGALDKDHAALAGLQSEIKKQMPKVSYKAVQKEMNAKIGEVLDTGIDDVLAAAWKKYKGFQEYADQELHPPGETVLVPLAAHTIQSAHSPHIDLMIRKVTLGSVHLDVELALQLEGVLLKVQDGKILDVRAGSCQAFGSLKCSVHTKAGEKELLSLEKETPKFQLAGAVSLGSGITIPPAGGKAES